MSADRPSALRDMAEAIAEAQAPVCGVLEVLALDGGVGLRFPAAGGIAELRIGWRRAQELASKIDGALNLAPPWTAWPSYGDWTDDGLKVAEYPVSRPKGDGREPVDAVFVRFLRPDRQGHLGGDGALAVFAGDHHPDGRSPSNHVLMYGCDGQGGIAGRVAELAQRWEDEGIGPAPEVFIGPRGVILDADDELDARYLAHVAAINEAYAPYLRLTDSACAARGGPVDLDVQDAVVRQDQVDHVVASPVAPTGDSVGEAG